VRSRARYELRSGAFEHRNLFVYLNECSVFSH
jgi:hypothetical protein